jgi:hypothetical protein
VINGDWSALKWSEVKWSDYLGWYMCIFIIYCDVAVCRFCVVRYVIFICFYLTFRYFIITWHMFINVLFMFVFVL